MSATTPVKKACDACHRRKVRCSGGQPCKNCGQSSLQCTYLAIPQKKGPKGSRAKVISEIRDTQHAQQNQLPPTPTRANHDYERNPFDFNSPPISPSNVVRNNELLTNLTVESCINFFFAHHYPTMPIFNRAKLNALVADYRTGPAENYCLVLSLCAFIMVQPGMSFEGVPMPESYDEDPISARYRHANLLIREIHFIRKTLDYVENPTVQSVQISFFLFGSYFGLDKTNPCWYYMREASTLAHLLCLDDEATYKHGDRVENMYNRRLYWLLLVTERALSIERHRPLSMLSTIELPNVDEEPAETAVISGFLYLATLFRLIDDEFMALWNKARSDCTVSYLSQLQQHLTDALPPTLECTENQAADVKVTHHWLRCMVWQLSITNGLLSSSSTDIAMTFRYPIQIAKDLIRDLQPLSLQSMEVHGVGLIEKLFDISCTLSDVIACVPMDQPINGGTADTPQNYLNQLLNLISRLRGGASRYVPLLMAKVSENVQNTAHPLAHMPHTLDAFLGDSPTSSASPHTSVSQPQTQYPSSIRPPAFGETSTHGHSPTPSSSSAHHQQHHGLYESYTPGASSHSDMGMGTPLSPEYPSPYGHGQQGQQGGVPRSFPLGQTSHAHYEGHPG